MADDVADVMAELDLAGVPILGFSDGGNIALDLAARHPGLAGPLIVVGANLDPSGLTPATKLMTDLEHVACRSASRFVPGLGWRVERLALMATDPAIDPAELQAVTQPVLVVVGERDVIRPEHTDLIVAALPDAELLRIPRVGHMIPIDAAPPAGACRPGTPAPGRSVPGTCGRLARGPVSTGRMGKLDGEGVAEPGACSGRPRADRRDDRQLRRGPRRAPGSCSSTWPSERVSSVRPRSP